MTNECLTLRDVLTRAEELDWQDALYAPQGASSTWTLDTAAMLHDPDDVDDIDKLPDAVSKHGFGYVLMIQTVQDVVANAKEQRPNASPEDLLEAFLFYYRNDAFIEFRQ